MKKEISYYGIGVINGIKQNIVHFEIVDCENKALLSYLTKYDTNEMSYFEKTILTELSNQKDRLDASWLELSIEKRLGHEVYTENSVLFANVSIGQLPNQSFPIGISFSNSTEIGFNNFQKIVKSFKCEFENLKGLVNTRHLILNPYSSGVFIHETLGHLAEQNDYINKETFDLNNLEIIDLPKMALDYSFDDNQKEGVSVNLNTTQLSEKTGNLFCGIDNQQKVERQIRQRNLLIRSLNTYELNNDDNNLLIYRAGINPKQNFIELLIYINGRARKVRLPICDICGLSGIRNDDRQFLNVCWKNKVSRYIGFQAGWIELEIKKSLEEYFVL